MEPSGQLLALDRKDLGGIIILACLGASLLEVIRNADRDGTVAVLCWAFDVGNVINGEEVERLTNVLYRLADAMGVKIPTKGE